MLTLTVIGGAALVSTTGSAPANARCARHDGLVLLTDSGSACSARVLAADVRFDRGCHIDENDGGTRQPTRRRLVGVCVPQSVIRAAVSDQICYKNGLRTKGWVSMASKTAEAIRQRRHRDRRARGFRCAIVEICDADIRALVDRGYLDRLQQHNIEEIQAAVHRLLDHVLIGHQHLGTHNA